MEGCRGKGGILNSRILQNHRPSSPMEDSSFITLSISIYARIFQFPSIAPFIVNNMRVVIATVEVLKDTGEDFGLFIWEGDMFS